MTEKQIEYWSKINSLKQYFKTESLKTILGEWEDLGDDFDGVTIKQFSEELEERYRSKCTTSKPLDLSKIEIIPQKDIDAANKRIREEMRKKGF